MQRTDPTLLLGPFLLMKRRDRSYLPITPVLPVSLLDVNECIKGSQNCRLGETCVNTVGSFRCQRDSSCGTGYELTEDNDCKGTTGSGSQNLTPGSRCDVMRKRLGGSRAPRAGSPSDCLGPRPTLSLVKI